MATVTIDADMLARLQEAAGYPIELANALLPDAPTEARINHVAIAYAVESKLQPGDLDPVDPDPDPSVGAMLRELLLVGDVEIEEGAVYVTVRVFVDRGDGKNFDPVAGEGVELDGALRAAYRQVVVGE